MRRLACSALLILGLTAYGADTKPAVDTTNRANLTIVLEPLGDTDQGVVSRVTFRYAVPEDAPPEVPLAVQGSFMRGGEVVRNFRVLIRPDQRNLVKTIQTFPEGEITVEARLLIPLEEESPIILGKTAKAFTIARTNKQYVASADEGAEAIFAEGIVPETVGAVKIRPPRRDVAPNLFIIDADVKPPVKRVEFWVEGKKILVRNAAPYRAELDLGKLPKRVEVRVVGYDASGRYIDADAFVVNERETPLEVKITRTVTPDNVSHIKLSIQNPKNAGIKSVVLFAGQKKIHEWSGAPYAIDIPNASLAGVDFVRASVLDDTNYEASDLLFLNGQRYSEEIDVNLVELPVSVTNAAGVPIPNLEQKDFSVFESGKPQKVSAFNYASNMPISVGVLLDHSGSMLPRIKDAKIAAIQFFKEIMKPQDRAFFGGFAFDSKNLAPFVSDPSLVEAQVNASPDAAGGTALYDAIVTGLYRFRSIQGRKALITITDGEDTSSRLAYEDMLLYVRAARVPLYFIGIGLGFGDISGTGKMKALANETGGVSYFIRDVKQLKETYAQLEKDLRSQYFISYYAETTKGDQKYRTVDVKVNRPDARVRTIRGYIP